MRILPNALSRILVRDAMAETRLGCPSADEGARARRRAALCAMTGGRGFYQDPKGPKLKGGKTRRERTAHYRERYARNLAAEESFRDARAGAPGWSIAAIRNAIEQREHLK